MADGPALDSLANLANPHLRDCHDALSSWHLRRLSRHVLMICIRLCISLIISENTYRKF